MDVQSISSSRPPPPPPPPSHLILVDKVTGERERGERREERGEKAVEDVDIIV